VLIYLELATKALKQKISNLEEEENAMLFKLDANSTDADVAQLDKSQI